MKEPFPSAVWIVWNVHIQPSFPPASSFSYVVGVWVQRWTRALWQRRLSVVCWCYFIDLCLLCVGRRWVRRWPGWEEYLEMLTVWWGSGHQWCPPAGEERFYTLWWLRIIVRAWQVCQPAAGSVKVCRHEPRAQKQAHTNGWGDGSVLLRSKNQVDKHGPAGAGWAAQTGIRRRICRRDESSVSDWEQEQGNKLVHKV